MIRIYKGPAPPELLAIELARTQADKLAFEANRAGYLSGTQKFEITDDYKISVVKETLLSRQHNKCCYSEAKFSGDFPHVEHFRPKARVDIWGTQTRHYPGYYWLAYNWINLFLSKQLINVSYKKNFFPLADEALRNRCHLDTNLEVNLIIDPGAEDPRDHIRFHNDEPVGITERGRDNIRILGLRHSGFEESRREKLTKLQAMKELVDVSVAAGLDVNMPLIARTIAILRSSILPDAEFSSMAIDFLSGWPHLL